MKKIRIFLASSINDLYAERQEISNFICRTLRKAFGNAVDFELEMCEDDMGLVSKERKQDAYNQYIRESDYLYILFYHDAGEFTVEEFQAAYDRFRETDKPKIIPFVKVLAEGDKGTEALETFIRYMREELQHYYVEFRHVDTVKLRILMALAQDPELHMIVKLQDSEVMVNEQILKDEKGESAINVDNIPFYRNHDAISRLRTEVSELESSLLGARMEAVKDPSNQQKWNTITRISVELNQKLEELHEFEMKLLETSMRFTKMTTDGSYITPRTKKAIELFEMGDMERALTMLDQEAFEADLRRAEDASEIVTHQMEALVKELTTKIGILMSQGVTKENEGEIKELYERARTIILRHRLKLDCVVDYMDFLQIQNDHTRALQVGDQLYHEYKSREDTEGYAWARFCTSLADLYSKNQKTADAEQLYREALEIYLRLYAVNQAAYESDVANISNTLAILCADSSKVAEAEDLYLDALEIYCRLAVINPDAYNLRAAMTCNNLANLYRAKKDTVGAKKWYLDALDFFGISSDDIPYCCHPLMAIICGNLAELYLSNSQTDEAFKFLRVAVNVYRRLSCINPSAYDPLLAVFAQNLAHLCASDQKPEEAELLYREALDINRRLAAAHPLAFEPDFAVSCYSLSSFLGETDQERARELQEEAFKIAIKYKDDNDACSVIYDNLKSFFE